jgi:hypothetical protein
MKRKVIFVVLALVLLLAPMSTLADTVLATRTFGHYVATLSTNNAGCYTYAVTDTQKNTIVFSFTFCKK